MKTVTILLCKPCMLGAFIPIFILFAILFIIFTLIEWGISKSQVRDFCNIYGRGNYKLFKREFNKVKWEWQPMWRNSLFDNTNYFTSRSQIHAGIFEFQGKGMTLGYFDYLRVQLFLWTEIAKYRYKIMEQNIWR